MGPPVPDGKASSLLGSSGRILSALASTPYTYIVNNTNLSPSDAVLVPIERVAASLAVAWPALLTYMQAAEATGLSVSTLRRLSAAGGFPCAVQIDGLRGERVRRVDVENWLASLAVARDDSGQPASTAGGARR